MDLGQVLSLAGPVAAAFMTGGASALPQAIPGLLGIGGALLKKRGEDPELKFAQAKIEEWADVYKKLMDIPMLPEVKKSTAMDMIRGDYAKKFAKKPKERWVEQMHALMVMGVKGELVVEGLR